MIVLVYLIPIALLIAGISAAAFLWAVNNKQFDDLDKEATKILLDDDNRG